MGRMCDPTVYLFSCRSSTMSPRSRRGFSQNISELSMSPLQAGSPSYACCFMLAIHRSDGTMVQVGCASWEFFVVDNYSNYRVMTQLEKGIKPGYGLKKGTSLGCASMNKKMWQFFHGFRSCQKKLSCQKDGSGLMERDIWRVIFDRHGRCAAFIHVSKRIIRRRMVLVLSLKPC